MERVTVVAYTRTVDGWSFVKTTVVIAALAVTLAVETLEARLLANGDSHENEQYTQQPSVTYVQPRCQNEKACPQIRQTVRRQSLR